MPNKQTRNDIVDGTVTHLCNGYVQIADRLIQRCSICGDKILDLKVSQAGLLYYPAGTFLRYFPDPSHYEVIDVCANCGFPEDFCLNLVEM